MKIKVSLIVPVYKTEIYLRACLDSVLAQSLKEIEVICINDGSPDGSLAILREYEKRDSRVKIIDKKNEGVGRARNEGIRAARGKYIGFMDSDDYYPHERVLERLYSTAETNEVQVCCGYFRMVHSDGSFEDKPTGNDGRAPRLKGRFRYAEYQYDYGFWGGIYDRIMLIENGIFFPSYGRFQDPPFFVNAMIAAGEFYALDEPTYCYREVQYKGKTNIQKTMDMLLGIRDNLNISRMHNLSRLHYITACRLNEDASYMANQNLFDPRNKDLISRLIRVTGCVDIEWLKAEGFDLPEPFLPQTFEYLLELAGKYEKIRQNKIVRTISKFRRLFY